jgi:hypothetical protein
MSSKRYKSIYIFEWKDGRGSIATVPADSLKVAFARVLVQLDALDHYWARSILVKAYKAGVLSKLIKVHRSQHPKGMVWQRVKPPHG